MGKNGNALLSKESKLERFPTHLLKRVDRPTNTITDQVKRVDPRESPFGKAARGLYGTKVQKRFFSITAKDALTTTLSGSEKGRLS